MRASFLVWVFPVGILGGLVAISLGSVLGFALALAWGFIAFPYCAGYVCRHARRPDGSAVGPDDHELATDYWRTTLR